MKILVTGDSMIKYLSESLSENLNRCEIELKSFPGIRIEELMERLPSLSLNSYDIVLMHVGTNNSEEDVDAIVRKFVCLFDTIFCLNPTLKVLISGVIPRGPDRFRDDFGENDTFYLFQNQKIETINSELRRLSLSRGYSFFMRNPEGWKGCLGRDGLHLNYKGNGELASDFVKQLQLAISVEYVRRWRAKSIHRSEGKHITMASTLTLGRGEEKCQKVISNDIPPTSLFSRKPDTKREHSMPALFILVKHTQRLATRKISPTSQEFKVSYESL
ncbi:hypothetical protein AVEN_274035-1 [Araneus ventricosus]|uniref:SGNH hydrolase-type esterase domain-containing protein n=1 Tax=Araneus ventricosus TaxID=182803 RepID=A0A4Y2W437_ARAVE|nr:hypothetical protein AVEN_274035-1 [Araneus ventricosus]